MVEYSYDVSVFVLVLLIISFLLCDTERLESRSEMDPLDASRVLYSRIQKLEPENITKKIVGYLLLQKNDEEIIRLAFGPDQLIQNLIYKAKIELGFSIEISCFATTFAVYKPSHHFESSPSFYSFLTAFPSPFFTSNVLCTGDSLGSATYS
ncbi:hypothetical protein F0562_009999 [Nyssa sinensis]|uniref:AtC3H46-like PABC-like domain-containing protein n=1 Tax=Nyssa sinensis TaxID=561372 RepID=A0A5J5A0H1_9ASTE|nr:hypothetical protein F0562_009999 [Nyssa sinensis]